MIGDEDDPNNEFVEDAQATEERTVDASSKQSLRKRERKRDRALREKDIFWKQVFSSEVGRREMFDILTQCHAFEERFACGPNGFPQPEATWFHAGEQAVGQRLFQSWCILDRAGAFAMLDECDPRFFKSKIAKKDNE